MIRLSSRDVIRQSLVLLVLVAVLLPPACLLAAETVESSIKKKSAWTGEAVPMTVKLFSPGPFDGTPAFDLPQLPLTTIIKTPGSPVVQSEDVDGDSWFTQQHEFVIYTQRQGEIVIPSFQVRFNGKKSFTGEAEPIQGKTRELQFQSKRPPGTHDLGFVVAVSAMKISQSWMPDSDESMQAGDVVERKISRHADDTTAMMLSPFNTTAPSGIQVYTTDPVVRDDTERGAFRAERMDTIKYQFPRGGTFELPDMTVTWWDTKSNSLQHQTLAGKSVAVTAAPQRAATEPNSSRLSQWPEILIVIIMLAVAAWIVCEPATRAISRWREKRHHLLNRVAKRARSACEANDATAAYVALMDWQHEMDATEASWPSKLTTSLAAEFQDQFAALTRRLYAGDEQQPPWRGQSLADTFNRVRSELSRFAHSRHTRDALPGLNPMESCPRESATE